MRSFCNDSMTISPIGDCLQQLIGKYFINTIYKHNALCSIHHLQQVMIPIVCASVILVIRTSCTMVIMARYQAERTVAHLNVSNLGMPN